MPDENGQPLPPIEQEMLDGETFTTEIDFTPCKHEFEQKSPTKIICKKCGLCLKDSPLEMKKLFDLLNKN